MGDGSVDPNPKRCRVEQSRGQRIIIQEVRFLEAVVRVLEPWFVLDHEVRDSGHRDMDEELPCLVSESMAGGKREGGDGWMDECMREGKAWKEELLRCLRLWMCDSAVGYLNLSRFVGLRS